MSQQQVNPFQQRVIVIFGVVVVWLIFGVYFKNSIGKWFAAIYYIISFALIGMYVYQKFFKPKDRDKTIKDRIPYITPFFFEINKKI